MTTQTVAVETSVTVVYYLKKQMGNLSNQLAIFDPKQNMFQFYFPLKFLLILF